MAADGTPKIKNLPTMISLNGYREYLESEHWRKLKGVFFTRSQRVISMRLKYGCVVCEFCKKKGKFNLHHKTYERLGGERLTDLIILCDECHKLVHSMKSCSLKSATRRVRKLMTSPHI